MVTCTPCGRVGQVGLASFFFSHNLQKGGSLAYGGVASSSWAVILTVAVSGHGLPSESVSSIMICVGWLTVADVRPGPRT